MRKYTKEQYIEMSEKFNKMTFINKIITLQKNKEIFSLGADYNWFGVKLKNKEMQEVLDNEEITFNISDEWGTDEIYCLLNILEIDITDI